jgi:hypothetical protein
MKDITVIIPVLNAQLTSNDLVHAVNSVKECQKYYNDGELKILIVVEKAENGFDYTVFDDIKYKYIVNDTGKYDYCSQINFGVKHVDTEFFSILEYDDYYTKKWFKMFNDYYDTNADVSVFLPINIIHNSKTNEREFVNDIIWSNGFANEIGYIDFECLQASGSFNLTGGIFKTSDWLGYKPSIKVAFNYEYLLRSTHKKQKIFVVPKEGYHHEIFRENSLSDQYMNTVTDDENMKWFEVAKREYAFDEDRNKGIINIKDDENK